MKKDELTKVLDSHALWLENNANGKRANLRDANLQWANLQWANLRNADLRNADLRDADLRDASLRDADLDFSAWPLWCGSKNVQIDEKLAKQLLAHAFNVGLSFWPGELTEKQKEFLNDFHRIKSNEFTKFN